jgi:hypothetical protein
VNLGVILWVPLLLIALLPFAWLVDKFCSVRDEEKEKFGGRKPLTGKPLVQMIVNLLSRYALVSVLDVTMLVFLTLSAYWQSAFESIDGQVNSCICYTLLSLFAAFIIVIIVHGCWRNDKVKFATTWVDFNVSGYICTLYDGMNIHHPECTTISQLAFIARQVAYAATIVFLYD